MSQIIEFRMKLTPRQRVLLLTFDDLAGDLDRGVLPRPRPFFLCPPGRVTRWPITRTGPTSTSCPRIRPTPIGRPWRTRFWRTALLEDRDIEGYSAEAGDIASWMAIAPPAS